MKVSHLTIENFRGIKAASLLLPDHAILIGDNNTGKSTILEALDLVLGPDRLSRTSPIDEHDFHLGRYGITEELSVDGKEKPPTEIRITATVTGLSPEQAAHFGAHLEWWDTEKQALYVEDAVGSTKPLRSCVSGSPLSGVTIPMRMISKARRTSHGRSKKAYSGGFLYLCSIRTGRLSAP